MVGVGLGLNGLKGGEGEGSFFFLAATENSSKKSTFFFFFSITTEF